MWMVCVVPSFREGLVVGALYREGRLGLPWRFRVCRMGCLWKVGIIEWELVLVMMRRWCQWIVW